MKNIGAGIAIVGIWIGVGLVAMIGQPAGPIAIAAMFATIGVAIFLRDN